MSTIARRCILLTSSPSFLSRFFYFRSLTLSHVCQQFSLTEVYPFRTRDIENARTNVRVIPQVAATTRVWSCAHTLVHAAGMCVVEWTTRHSKRSSCDCSPAESGEREESHLLVPPPVGWVPAHRTLLRSLTRLSLSLSFSLPLSLSLCLSIHYEFFQCRYNRCICVKNMHVFLPFLLSVSFLSFPFPLPLFSPLFHFSLILFLCFFSFLLSLSLSLSFFSLAQSLQFYSLSWLHDWLSSRFYVAHNN